MLQAPPHDFRAGAVAPAAPHKPAERGDPGDRLTQRRRLCRRRGDPMDGTIPRLPFVRLQQDAIRHLRHRARQHGGVKIRHASTLSSAKARRKRSACWHGRAARWHPLCTIRCQTSIPPRQAYHGTRSRASSTGSTATVVHNSPALGSASAGGSTAHPCTAHSTTAGKPAALRGCGGRKVKGPSRRANVASRAGCAPRRGTGRRSWAATGWAATVSATYRCGALTPRCHEARSSRSTPTGRGAARTSYTSASRSPTLLMWGVGQQARAVETASRRWSHF